MKTNIVLSLILLSISSEMTYGQDSQEKCTSLLSDTYQMLGSLYTQVTDTTAYTMHLRMKIETEEPYAQIPEQQLRLSVSGKELWFQSRQLDYYHGPSYEVSIFKEQKHIEIANPRPAEEILENARQLQWFHEAIPRYLEVVDCTFTDHNLKQISARPTKDTLSLQLISQLDFSFGIEDRLEAVELSYAPGLGVTSSTLFLDKLETTGQFPAEVQVQMEQLIEGNSGRPTGYASYTRNDLRTTN